jgi:hypothetical protein
MDAIIASMQIENKALKEEVKKLKRQKQYYLKERYNMAFPIVFIISS